MANSNDIIECLSEFVRPKMENEISNCYAIIADKVNDRFSNKEILLLCLRYVRLCANKKPYICETFVPKRLKRVFCYYFRERE